jgi:hypothetical protein
MRRTVDKLYPERPLVVLDALDIVVHFDCRQCLYFVIKHILGNAKPGMNNGVLLLMVDATMYNNANTVLGMKQKQWQETHSLLTK